MKWNIEKKLLVLVLAAGILSFLTLSGFSFYGMTVMRSDMKDLGEEVGKAGAILTGNLMTYQLKRNLSELAKARAEFIDHETFLIRQNVETLASTMTRIASNPERYKPVKLLDPRNDEVKNTEPYVVYSPEILQKGISPEIKHEVEIAGNVGIVLSSISKSFIDYKSSFYVGSKNGWFICSSVYPEVTGNLQFSQEEIYHYDNRLRPWYKNAINAGRSVFSDLYTNIDTDEYQLLGCSAPYYDRNGVAGVVGLDISNTDIYDVINSIIVGENGFSFVLNNQGRVILSSRTSGDLAAISNGQDLRKSSEESLASAARRMAAGKSGISPVMVDGEEYFLAYAPMKNIGWSFGALTLRKDIFEASDESEDYFLAQVDGFLLRLQNEFFLLTLAGLILLGCLSYIFLSASRNVSARFVKPIHALADGVRDIASGDLDKKLNIRTGDEIEHLAVSFNAMTYELKTYMKNLAKETAEKERIATELDVATEIQRGMLPKDFPDREDFQLFATMTPAKKVGGDFYDFYFLDETHLAITVADVSGKGIPAALFMVISQTVLRNFAVSTHNRNGLAEVVAAANDKLCASNDAMMFVTAFIGVLDLETGEFIYVNAGHNPPVIYRAENNHCDFLDVDKNFVLGPMDGIPFVEQKISLKNGDLLFLYTDGVTEALNVENEEYLPDRLINFMNSTDCKADLQTLLKNIRGDLAKHVGEAEQSDDITMFALRFKK